MLIEQKIASMGLVLPPPYAGNTKRPFVEVLVVGNLAYIAGHGAQYLDPEQQITGKLGAEVSIEQGYHAAKLTALSMLSSLKRELGDLDRIVRWVKLFGMVNCVPEFEQTPAVINVASEFILELFGEEAGSHVRSAVGMSSLPGNMPVEIEGIVMITEL